MDLGLKYGTFGLPKSQFRVVTHSNNRLTLTGFLFLPHCLPAFHFLALDFIMMTAHDDAMKLSSSKQKTESLKCNNNNRTLAPSDS